ncbi:MAG: FHA domain-containing protein, partial [Nocardioides sp.]
DGLIDGIPAEILASRAGDPPPAPAPVVTADPVDDSRHRLDERVGHTVRRAADPDHDGRTTFRPDHLHQPTHETVLAVRCAAGHLTAAFVPVCRVCAGPVPPQEPGRVPRPQLGVIRLPDGDTVPLDRGVVLGRQPTAPPETPDWPHLVRVPQDLSYVSRVHLRIELDGWLVLATDQGSRSGTTLRVPGRPPERIRAHQQYVWEPGQVLDLADCFEIELRTQVEA